MVIQNFQTREEAEVEAERLHAIGLPATVIRIRTESEGHIQRLWQVVAPHDDAIFAGRKHADPCDDEADD
jgi:hypothetical protein